MSNCLFCESEGPFTRPEHIIPEALGNDDLVLVGEVCDHCNQYFGTKVEAFVLGKTPLAFWRTFLGIRKKKGGRPHVDLSQPRRQKGRFPANHRLHDNLVGFTCHPDYSVSVDIDDDALARDIVSGERDRFTFVFTPQVLVMMGRFLCKIGVELVCTDSPPTARGDAFFLCRSFARFGTFEGLWPIFHFQSGELGDLRARRSDPQGVLEEVRCYEYRLLNVGDKYTVLAFAVGTDTWTLCLNDPYPTPAIRTAFPGKDLNLIWYDPDEVASTGGPTSPST